MNATEQWGPPPPPPPPRASVWTWLALALIVTSVALTAGFLLKRSCRYDGDQYKRDCYSDIVPLYGGRGAPFNDETHRASFATHGLAYRDVNLEYPALTGLFISAMNSGVKMADSGAFLRTNALGMSALALAGAAALAVLALRKRRILLFAMSPALVAYAFHNWDLIPVALTALAMLAFARERDWLAGILLGLGAAAKLYPAFLVPVLLVARAHQNKSGRPLFLWSILGFLVPNVVVAAYAGLGSWWFPWKFQSTRLPNFETWGYFLSRHLMPHVGTQRFWFGSTPGCWPASPDVTCPPFGAIAQYASIGVFVVGGALLLGREWRRPQFRPFTTCLGVLLIFLLTTKVFSPQYAIWLLPFFVVVGVPWYGYAAFAFTDMLVLGAIWAFLLAGGNSRPQTTILEIAVWVRYAALAFVLWLTRRSEELVEPA